MSEGYIKIRDLFDFCDNQKDHSITPNDFMRMNHSYFMESYPCWISVKDRLPPMYHMVLITGKNSAGKSFGVIKGSHDGDKGQWYRDDIGQYVDSRGDTVTHWMPLPELPMEEAQK